MAFGSSRDVFRDISILLEVWDRNRSSIGPRDKHCCITGPSKARRPNKGMGQTRINRQLGQYVRSKCPSGLRTLYR